MLMEMLCLPFTVVCDYSPNITQNRKSKHPTIVYKYRELWICFHEHAAFDFALGSTERNDSSSASRIIQITLSF